MSPDEFLAALDNERPIRLILAGAAGVGKSHLAQEIHRLFAVPVVEHDSLKTRVPGNPCGPRDFILRDASRRTSLTTRSS